MAEHRVGAGAPMYLYIDPAGGTDYSTVVCLTRVSKSDSVDTVDSASACGPNKSIGSVNISYSAEGYHIQDADTGKISGTSLRQLLRSRTTVGFKISPETPVEGDEVETGTGFLSSLSSDYAFDADATFTLELQPFGSPVITVAAGSSKILAENDDNLITEDSNYLIQE